MSHRRDIGIVGAGRAGMSLAIALGRAGWPVRALSSRDPDGRAMAARTLPGTAIGSTPGEVAAATDLVLLAVPDDVVSDVASSLGARPGSVVAHLSGTHPAALLREVVPSDVAVGAFHPLVAFADAERAVDALRGAWVAIDGEPTAVEALGSLAEALGCRPVVLGGEGTGASDPVVAKAAHHTAAVLAAGGFIALLDAIAELGLVAGLDGATAIEVYGSLVTRGLANADALGVVGSLTGPVPRGDVGTVRLHLDTIAVVAPAVRETYRALARRQLAVAKRGGMLDDANAARMEAELEVD